MTFITAFCTLAGLIAAIMSIDTYLIPSLRQDNAFRKWWERNVISEGEED